MQSTRRRRPLEGQRFDVAIIGGGINGVAIARECARAGRSTLLLEKRDFASGTTSRSTRIIHGGLRYLEHGELGLVRESLRERQRLLQESPHLVRPLKFVLALPAGARHSALAIRSGLWFYRTYSRQKNGCTTNPLELERLLDQGRKWALFSYQDAQCEFPERLVADWLNEAVQAGAVVRNYASALSVSSQHGRVRGLLFRDELSQTEQQVEATWLINASGPWADLVCQQLSVRTSQPMLGAVRGSHIVLPRFPSAPEAAIYTEASDQRPFFVIPWNSQLLVGTTEACHNGDPGAAAPTQAEIEYLLASVRQLFPAQRFPARDIKYAFAGVRPLPYSPGRATAAVTRRHLLHDHADDGMAGMISILGGKLTTAASLARECARKIGISVPEPIAALVAPAPADGIAASFRQWAEQISRIANIPTAAAQAIAEWHGRCALQVARLASQDELMRAPLCSHSPHIVAEAIIAAQSEHAVTLGDILLRRVPVAFSACWSEECSRTAANRIGAGLSLTSAQVERELEYFEQERRAFLQPEVLTAARGREGMPSAASAEGSV